MILSSLVYRFLSIFLGHPHSSFVKIWLFGSGPGLSDIKKNDRESRGHFYEIQVHRVERVPIIYSKCR